MRGYVPCVLVHVCVYVSQCMCVCLCDSIHVFGCVSEHMCVMM